jgi:hypothetical protein
LPTAIAGNRLRLELVHANDTVWQMLASPPCVQLEPGTRRPDQDGASAGEGWQLSERLHHQRRLLSTGQQSAFRHREAWCLSQWLHDQRRLLPGGLWGTTSDTQAGKLPLWLVHKWALLPTALRAVHPQSAW